jgi:hypothetical protein
LGLIEDESRLVRHISQVLHDGGIVISSKGLSTTSDSIRYFLENYSLFFIILLYLLTVRDRIKC